MTISATQGPYVQYRGNNLGAGGTGSANQNPEAGPAMLIHGQALLDGRFPFTYKPGQGFGSPTCGFLNGLSCVAIDQVPSAISAANIAASQTPAAAALTLVSSSGSGITVGTSITRADTGATVTGLLAIDTAMSTVTFGEAATVQMWDPTKAVARNVRITSGGNDTGITFLVVGYDLYGYPMSEAITGANAGVASGVKAFKYITSITPSGAVATTASAGTGDVIGLPIRVDRIPYLTAWWGNPQTQVIGAGGTSTGAEQKFIIPAQLADFADSQVWKIAVPFAFTVKSALFRTGKPATTAAKATTLTLTVSGTAVTGGVIALTSANQATTGTGTASSAISGAGATGAAGGTIEFTASSTTAFVEGDGYIEVTITNNELQGGTFTAAVTTTASTTTGDTRGTIALGSASDGTRRLTVFISPMVSNISNVTSGIFGVTQNLASNNG